MTRIAVFSDLHGGSDRAIQAAFESFDYVAYLGDGLSKIKPYEYVYPEKCLFVRGNCDGYDETPTRRIVDIEGVRIMLTHGHEERVKYGLLTLLSEAKKEEVQVVLFGHTHRPENSVTDGILFVNPGTAAGYYDRNGTSAILTVSNGKYFVEIVKND